MAFFGIPTTNYERNAGNRRKTKAQEAADRQAARNTQATSALAGGKGNILSGTEAEQEGQLAGLNVGNIGYGQGLETTGQDIQRIKELQKQRTGQSGGDPVSAAIMGQKAGSQAVAQRSMAASGVKGGAAAGAIEAIGRQKDADIAASLYGQQRQSIADERSLAGNMLSGQTSLMQGEKAANVQLPSAPSGGGGITVICTELHRQGIMSPEIYKKDAEYGASLPLEVMAGYSFWATPIASKMKTSPLLTSIVKIPAMKWAKHIAGVEKSLFGYACQYIAEPVCGLIGTILFKFTGAKYV